MISQPDHKLECNEAGLTPGLPDTRGALVQQFLEAANAYLRSKIEYPFRVIKQQFELHKTRLQDMAKNLCKVNMIAAQAKLVLARRQLLERT